SLPCPPALRGREVAPGSPFAFTSFLTIPRGKLSPSPGPALLEKPGETRDQPASAAPIAAKPVVTELTDAAPRRATPQGDRSSGSPADPGCDPRLTGDTLNCSVQREGTPCSLPVDAFASPTPLRPVACPVARPVSRSWKSSSSSRSSRFCRLFSCR